jgi:hypothetical protein
VQSSLHSKHGSYIVQGTSAEHFSYKIFSDDVNAPCLARFGEQLAKLLNSTQQQKLPGQVEFHMAL